jgi:tRNA1(Val) A37 N6-methylase TrmN6
VTPEETSLDEILGGRLRLRQSRAGHRVGTDAVLLAAMAGPAADRLVDVGSGVGAVGLALLRRWPAARGDLVEIDPRLTALARENAAINGVSDRTRILELDILAPAARRAAGLPNGEADLVITNPPFFTAGAVRGSPDARRALAHVFAAPVDAPLRVWIVASLALLAPGGRFAMIHRPEALPELLAAFGERLGAVAIRPVHPRAEADATRLLVQGVKGSKAPLHLMPALVLHDASGAFTPLASAIHRGEALL